MDGAAAKRLEILLRLASRGRGVGEGVDHADAIDRILPEAIDDLGRLDVEDVVERRRDVVDMMELRPRRFIRLDALRPRDHQRIARAAEMRGDQLGVAEWRVAGPSPAGMVHIISFGCTKGVEAADLVERGELLLDRVRDLILSEQLADGAVLAFGARAVVAED